MPRLLRFAQDDTSVFDGTLDRDPYPSRRIAAIPAAGPSASTGKVSHHPATSTSAGII